MFWLRWLLLASLVLGCGRSQPREGARAPSRPNLLLVTLDTTRADASGLEAPHVTPFLADLAARATVFRHAYTTAPATLPAHASMLTGLYPAGHGLHENGRRLREDIPLLAEELRKVGYTCAAFVSGFPLARASGLDRGFHLYDDEFLDQGGVERRADRTTDRAVAWLEHAPPSPFFLWVHYFDPHDPYEPPEPFRSQFADQPYWGEIRFVDEQLRRLIVAFEARSAHQPFRALFLGDHGEGLGEHGERHHGYLLYQGTVRVPLLLWDRDQAGGVRQDPVSVRQVRDTFLEAAGLNGPLSLTRPGAVPIPLIEAMEPFLHYRWQPQVAGVLLPFKLIRTSKLELYDLERDPRESRNLVPQQPPERNLLRAVRDYPLPSFHPQPTPFWSPEELARLQSLGYLGPSGSSSTPVPANAPNPADQAHLFEQLDAITRAFGRNDLATARSLLEQLVQKDPENLMAWVRLGAVRGQLGDPTGALNALSRARQIDPRSTEVAQAFGLEWLRQGKPEQALRELESVLAQDPSRLPALLASGDAAEQLGNLSQAIQYLDRALALARDPFPLYLRRGLLRMNRGETEAALNDLETAFQLAPERFSRHLELGVLLLAKGRLPEARAALDRALALDPLEPMALFKRAQVSALLGEPDLQNRIALALRHGTPETRKLVLSERLFAPYLPHLSSDNRN